jgi:alkanesulfonate monooxygenase SsuD/methylene tetrahydromethanopterin reductase-like flavin-dependent oxidoreductase (luciferase family)
MPRLRFGLSYDFRNPPDSGIAMPQLYTEALEQIVWAESLGFDQIWFTEHHFVDDGYLPSWVPVAGAVAARTQRMRISQDICILPFRNPVSLAEDLAVLDNLSGGRVELGVGMGYAPHEFRGFGFPVSRRLSLMEEGLEVLRRCFRGERFSFKGKRYEFNDVHIKPDYVQDGGPPLWVAAMARTGALRAAQYNCHLLPQGPRADVLDPWSEALSAAGHDPKNYRVGIIRGVLVTDDPERDWPRIREAERTRMRLYSRFFKESGQASPKDAARGEWIPQTWIVGNVDSCVETMITFITEHGLTDFVTWAVPPGLRPEEMNGSLERLARDVIPRVRAALED